MKSLQALLLVLLVAAPVSMIEVAGQAPTGPDGRVPPEWPLPAPPEEVGTLPGLSELPEEAEGLEDQEAEANRVWDEVRQEADVHRVWDQVRQEYRIVEDPVPPYPGITPVPRAGVLVVDERTKAAHAQANATGAATWAVVRETGATKLYPGQEAAQAGSLAIFADGVADDGGFGGFGSWQTLGDDSWFVSGQAARSGDSGYQLSRADGSYPVLHHSLLLSPELDLRSGASTAGEGPQEAVDNATSYPIREVWEGMLREAWGSLRDNLNTTQRTLLDVVNVVVDTVSPGANTPRNPFVNLGSSPNQVSYTPPSAALLHQATFQVRTNLQEGRDGFQVWVFTERPLGMPSTCEGTCHVVWADVEPEAIVRAFGNGPAYTGAMDWTRFTVSLDAFAGMSVWIGIAFKGAACPGGCTQLASSFDQDAGFFGLHVDDVGARVPAPPASLRLRPVSDPWVVPLGRSKVTVAPGDIPVFVEVANLGYADQEFTLQGTLQSPAGTQRLPVVPLSLAPGRTATVIYPLVGLGDGGYTFNVRAVGSLPDPVPADDSIPSFVFDVERVEAAALTSLSPNALQVRKSDPLVFTGVVRNLGNVPTSIRVDTALFDVTDNVTLGAPVQEMLGGPAVTMDLGIGQAESVLWPIATTASRQVQLQATVTGAGIEPQVRQSLAVGIDRSPPPLFYDDEISAKPRGLIQGDWTSTNPFMDQKWQDVSAAPYGLDPQVQFYAGKPQGDTCSVTAIEDCDPYATIQQQNTGGPGQYLERAAKLLTPIIAVDAAAPDPVLRFEHQISTASRIANCPHLSNSCPQTKHEMMVRGIGRLEGRVGKDDGLGGITWTDWTLLRSRTTPVMQGETAERVLGIYDPLSGPRAYSSTDSRAFCKGDILDPDTWQPCGWWWPSGKTYTFRAKFGDLNRLHDFGDGSPWLLEEIPLVANDGGDRADVSFDARGGYFQAQFVFPHSGHFPLQGVAESFEGSGKNLGWRIGSMAVLPTGSPVADLAVDAIQPGTPYNATHIGLGPGTTVTFNATVRNAGVVPVLEGTVGVVAVDEAGVPRGSGSSQFTDLEPGETRTVAVSWDVPNEEGLKLRVKATVEANDGGDDFPGDNTLWNLEVWQARRFVDLAPVNDVSPRQGTIEASRTTVLGIENRGNVPVTDALLTRTITRVTGLAQASGDGLSNTWTIKTTVQPGARVDLSDPHLDVRAGNTPVDPFFDLIFAPRSAGNYLQIVRTQVATGVDDDPVNDVAQTPFQVRSTLYRDAVETARRDKAILSGDALAGAAWSTADGGAGGSPLRLVVGDPLTNEIPLGTDSSYVLPAMDLSAVKQATLSFQHRFNLEQGFDGARVEVSVDNGATWVVAPPRPDPLHGLPLGYSSAPLLNDQALTDGEVAPKGVAYTGNSSALPGGQVDNGWIPAEFDLAQVPTLRRTMTVQSFDLEGLANTPRERTGNLPIDGTVRNPATAKPRQWTDATWELDEAGAAAAERYWWIENGTFGPRGKTETMWWSGTQGNSPDPVDTTLTFKFPGPTTSPVNLTWWEWRAGWRGSDRIAYSLSYDPDKKYDRDFQSEMNRDGTGGSFTVKAGGVQYAYATAPTVPGTRLDDGWSQRQVTLPAGVESVEFRYTASDDDGTPTPPDRLFGNRGWFIEEVALDGVLLSATDVTRAEGKDPSGAKYQEVKWSCIGTGSNVEGKRCTPRSLIGSQRSGGWHLKPSTLADGTTATVWSFSDGSKEGYPSNADGRLVTPVIDLAKVIGDKATLEFDHRYDFNADLGCLTWNGCQRTFGIPLSARDGGNVLVQVYNETRNTFEPWRVLANPVQPEAFATLTSFLSADIRFNDPAVANRLPSSGYPTLIAPIRGSDLLATRVPGFHVDYDGLGELFLYTPAYSGSSDWTTAKFDVSDLIGKRVRFAFHAATDGTASGIDPRIGWEVAAPKVVGEGFDGKPVLVRLRVVTDDSVRDGEWSVDGLEVSGDQYRQHVLVLPDATQVRGAQGQVHDLYGEIVNAAADSRLRLGLAATATAGTDLLPVTVVSPALPQAPNIGLPPGIVDLRRGLDLLPGERTPFHLRVLLPDEPGSVAVTLRIYQDKGRTDPETQQHVPDWVEPDDEVPGSTQATMVVQTSAVRDVDLVPPRADSTALLLADPPAPAPGTPINFTVQLFNNGTRPETVNAEWRIAKRPGKAIIHTETDVLQLVPGATGAADFSWTPSGPGVYRATLRLGQPFNDIAVLDVPVGTGLSVFKANVTDLTRWGIGFEPGSGEAGINNQWQATSSSLQWGIGNGTIGPGNHYCREADVQLCQPSGPQVSPVLEAALPPTGVRATATTLPIDLRAVPGDLPILTLRHRWSFAPGDGGLASVAVFRDSDGRDAICVDEDGQPAWLRLTPEDGYPGKTATSGASVNPLGAVPAFTGTSPGGIAATTLIMLADQDLRDQAPADAGCQGAAKPGGLLGRFIRVRLDVGTQARSDGERGWDVYGLSVGAGRIEVGPHAVPDIDGFERVLPVRDGSPKRFLVQVTNRGPTGDVANITLHPESAAPPDWVEILQPNLPLLAGQTGSVALRVSVPPEDKAARQRYSTPVLANSLTDPLTADRLDLAVRLLETRLPDLSVGLKLDGQVSGLALEAGAPAVISALVANAGTAPSKPVSLLFTATGPTGAVEVLHNQTLDVLCPVKTCGQAGFHSVSFDWIAPERPGDILLQVRADPAGRLTEARRDNNQVALFVEVIGSDAPDVAVANLRVEGSGPDGQLEEGHFATFSATVRNLGLTPATDVRITMALDGAVIGEELVAVLAPGAEQEIRVVKTVPPGDLVLKVVTTSSGAKADLDPTNDEQSRLLRVRSHDLVLEGPPGLAQILAGGDLEGFLRIANLGSAVDTVAITLAPGQPGWTLQAFPSPLVLLPGRDTAAFVQVHAPETALAGWHDVVVLAAPVSAPSDAARLVLPIEVIARPGDISLEVLATDLRGFDLTARVAVANAGNAPRTLQVAFAGGPASTVHVPGLSSAQTEVRLTLPGLSQMDRFPIVATDGQALVAQAMANPVLPTRAHVEAAWTRDGASDVGTDGQVTFEATLVNRGNLAIEVVAEPLGWVDARATPGELRLEPESTVVVHLEGPADRVPATGGLRIRSTVGDEVFAEIPWPASPLRPNLVLSPLRVEGTPREGLVTVGFDVANQGPGVAAPSVVLVYRETQLATAVPVPELKPGESLTLQARLDLPAGNQAIIAIADGDGRLTETVQEDNGASRILEVADGNWIRQIPAASPPILLALLALAVLLVRRRQA